MNYAAYGLGQGFANANNSNNIINAMNTASLIQYRRDQQRLQNRYADIAQQRADLDAEKWGLESQQQTLQLQAMQDELTKMKKANAGKDFGFKYFNAMTTGNWGAVNDDIANNEFIKPLAKSVNVASLSDPRDYTPEALRKYGVEVPEGMNLNDYVLIKGYDGSYRLASKQNGAALVGVGNVVDSYTLEQAQAKQKLAATNLSNQQLETFNKLGADLQATISSMQKQGTISPTDIKALSGIADELYNLQDPNLKAVKTPTAGQIKASAAQQLQEFINKPDLITDENIPTILELATQGGTPDQIKTIGTYLADKMFNKAFTENPAINFAEFQEKYPHYNQVINLMSQGLSKVQEDARKKTQVANKDMADIINKFDSLIVEKGLKKLEEDQTWAKADTFFNTLKKKYVTPLLNIEEVRTRQKTQGVFNTLLKLASGLAVTKSELETKIKELGDINTESAQVVISGFTNLAEALKAQIQEAAGQDPISLIEAKFKIRQLDNVISAAKSQLGISDTNTKPDSVASQAQIKKQQDNKNWLTQTLRENK